MISYPHRLPFGQGLAREQKACPNGLLGRVCNSALDGGWALAEVQRTFASERQDSGAERGHGVGAGVGEGD